MKRRKEPHWTDRLPTTRLRRWAKNNKFENEEALRKLVISGDLLREVQKYRKVPAWKDGATSSDMYAVSWAYNIGMKSYEELVRHFGYKAPGDEKRRREAIKFLRSLGYSVKKDK